MPCRPCAGRPRLSGARQQCMAQQPPPRSGRRRRAGGCRCCARMQLTLPMRSDGERGAHRLLGKSPVQPNSFPEAGTSGRRQTESHFSNWAVPSGAAGHWHRRLQLGCARHRGRQQLTWYVLDLTSSCTQDWLEVAAVHGRVPSGLPHPMNWQAVIRIRKIVAAAATAATGEWQASMAPGAS